MAIIKCKMCGGDLLLTEGSTIATCEYCGSQQTVPSADNEKKLTLFARANRLRMGCEFDKAYGVYEAIVADFPEEAEAYWGLVLCRYGIEYVDDPATGKKIPTCHRSSFDSVLEDQDYEQALENTDATARRLYREEGRKLEQLRRDILEASAKESPYDIFICYKETDEKGERTLDSVLAQDLYDELTEKGYRVFFSRISLEDKLGQAYEPCIFAALNSAKVMLAVGTDYEYFNAVWVKNEWSRFLKLIANGEKKTLIPCYKGMDPYDLPREFAKLQAQDLGKVGSMQDLLRGIDKILSVAKPVQATAQVQTEDLNRSFLYNSALDKMQENTIPALKTAVEKLESIVGWQDSAEKLAQAQKKLKKLKRKKLTKRLIIWGVILAIVGGIAGNILSQVYEEKQEEARRYYDRGESALANYNYVDAVNYFSNAGHYQDAAQQKEQTESWNQAAQAAFNELLVTYSGKSYYSNYGYISIDELSMNAGTLRHGGWTGSTSTETDSMAETIAPTMPTEPNGQDDQYAYIPLRCAIVYDTASKGLLLITESGDRYVVSWEVGYMTLFGSGEMDSVTFEEKGNLLMTVAQDLAQYGLYYGATLFCQAAGENADDYASRRLTQEEIVAPISDMISDMGGWNALRDEFSMYTIMLEAGELGSMKLADELIGIAQGTYGVEFAQAVDYIIFGESGIGVDIVCDYLVWY